MDIYATIILCFIPFCAVFVLFKILIQDFSIVKELYACLIGLIALIPIAIIQFISGNFFLVKNSMFFSLLVRAIILYGIIEEGIKCIVLFLFPTKKSNLKLMFFYSVLAGLFLGSFESVVYVINSVQKASSYGGEVLLNMIYLRTFTSIVIHTFASGLLGIFVYSVKNKKIYWKALIYPIFLHGVYDFFVLMQVPLNLFSYIAILLLLIECRVSYVAVRDLVDKTDLSDKIVE